MPSAPKRKHIRLRTFDYTSNGYYFVTVCAWERESIFGDVQNGVMTCSPIGHIVAEEWLHTIQVRKDMQADEHIVMPNHFHGILHIKSPSPDSFPQVDRMGNNQREAVCNTALRSPSQTVGAMVRGFKGAVTSRANRMLGVQGKPIWQGNYYEHIIRDEEDYWRIVEYIRSNPARWEDDSYFRE